MEEAVLAALMFEKDAYSMVSEILKPECFCEKSHEMIYAAIVDLALNDGGCESSVYMTEVADTWMRSLIFLWL